jgi:nicotinic acid phosphoribosyltransferase
MKPEEVDLKDISFTAELLSCVPGTFARWYRVLPIGTSQHEVLLAMADVSDVNAIETIQQLVGRDVALRVAESWQLDEFIDRLYGEESEP